MKIFGHRGAAGLAPENTLLSIRTALELGVDGIEFDVRCSRDRVPILIHDDFVDRTTDGTGPVTSYSLDNIRQLRISDTERIPTLIEALQTIGKQTLINVELKELAACQSTAHVIRSAIETNTIFPQQVLVTSFDHTAIDHFHRLAPSIAVGLLTHGLPAESYWALAEKLCAKSANIDLAAVDREFVDRAKKSGLQVMVYTVNSKQAADRMQQLGVHAIFSDFPNSGRT